MRWAIMVALALFTSAPAAAQQTEAKFALIIANFDYDGDGRISATPEAVTRAQERGYVGDLANPWFDSVRVGEALRNAGFAVEVIQNADRATMLGAVMRARFRAQSAGPDAALVIYYSGHGVQIHGRTYLVSARAHLTPAPPETPADVDRIGAVLGPSLQELLAGARPRTAPGYELFLVDACRDNPWEEEVRALLAPGANYVGERGFGALSLPARVIVGFSAQPGQLAQDGLSAASSPFANAIARRAGQRGLAIDQMLQSATGEVAATSGAQQIPAIVGRLGDATSLRR
ncbi:MAG: hypothetical protein GC189_04690 [Alphaproteobacteria bacterium]|nr:hypothetical protein [Alphaproteobacteria bacterium]